MPDPGASLSPALAAYARALDQARGPATAAGESGPASFGALLEQAMTDAVETNRTGEQVAIEALTGRVPLQEVIERVNAAELSLQAVVAVRDRLITAYQEIMRMPI